MSFRETVNNRTGVRRFYVNGRRVTSDTMNAAKFGRSVNTFQTITRGDMTRHYCEARD